MPLPPFRISRLDFTPTPDPSWRDVIYAEEIGVWLAVSPQAGTTADKVVRSTDGLTWTEHDLPTGANWNSLAWSGSLFACFCSNNSGIGVATSSDGITWSNAHAQNSNISSCAYGQGKFRGVGGQRRVIGPNVFSKSNFGAAATTRTVNINMSNSTLQLVGVVGGTTDTLTGITFNGVALTVVQKVQVTGDRWLYVYKLLSPSLGGTFALVVSFSVATACSVYISGYTNAGDVLQSQVDTGNSATANISLTTTYDESWLAQFTVNAADSAGTAGANTVVRQTSDGQGGTWADGDNNVFGAPTLTPPGSYSIQTNFTSSEWGAITLAFRPAVTEGFIRSGSGAVWTEHESPNDTLRGVCYSPELDLWCAVSGSGNGGPSGLGPTFLAYTSSDGDNWTARDTGHTIGPNLSAAGNCVIVWADSLGLFCAVMNDGAVIASDDGVTWFDLNLPVDSAVPAVMGVTWSHRLQTLIFFTEADSAGYKPLLVCEDGVNITAIDLFTTDDTQGDYSTGAYSPIDDRMVVFPIFDPYALLVEFGPHIVEVVPPAGNVVGGNTVQLIGTGFAAGMTAVFDNVYATDVNVISETLATCVVPPHLSTGLVDVNVANLDGRYDVGELLYEYNNGIDPDTGEDLDIPGISWMGSGCAPGAIVPSHGTMLGGTPFTIYGHGFKAGSAIYFGGLPATNVFIDATQPWLALVEAKNPDAWWRLEEADAVLVLADNSGNGHVATLPDATGKTSVRGGLSYSASKGIALSGGSKGFDCNGSQAAATFPDMMTLAGAFTIEFFVKVPAVAPSYGTVIGDTFDQDGIFMHRTGGQWFVSYESATEGYSDQTNTNPLTAGQIYHIALRGDGSGAGQWVIDGVADAVVPDIDLTGTLNCILDCGGFELTADLIDEIAVYDVELDDATLLNHSNNRDADYPALVLADGAITYWRCEEDDAATVLADSTGNGNDATQSTGGRTSVTGALADGHALATISPTIQLNGAYSIEFLFNPQDGAGVQALLTSLADLGFFIEADLSLRAEVAHIVTSDASLPADAISHVVFTASGALARWYINGVNHTSGAGTWDGTDDVTLAQMLADSTGHLLACNVLDELVVHSVELSPAEVLSHFTAARSWVSGGYATGVTPAHQTGLVDVEIVSP